MSKIVEALSSKAPALVTETLPEGPARDAALAGLKALEPAAAALGRLGSRKLPALAAVHAAGGGGEARALFEDSGGHLAALDRLNAEDLSELDSEEDIRAILAAVEKAGLEAIQAAIPFVIAVIGI